jgi:hypothetical protein
MAVPVQVVFDAHDPARVARFWAELMLDIEANEFCLQ